MPVPHPAPALPAHAHLRRDGTSVVLDLHAEDQPLIVHWGPDLGELTAEDLDALARASRPQRVSGALDRTPRASVLPQDAAGWPYTPGLEGDRDGEDFSTRLRLEEGTLTAQSAVFVLTDPEAGLTVRVELRLGVAGVLHQRAHVRNTGASPYRVGALRLCFPVPARAEELLETTGHHLRERAPQRSAFQIGSHVRESRRGRPGADSTLLLIAGQKGFAFERGVAHGVHLAWSGNQRLTAERTISGEALLWAEEVLAGGEVVLAPEEEYATPWALGSWGDGLNALSARFHAELRARPSHPVRPRPVTINTWEAVYFDQSWERLSALADAAAEVEVERFVLDDGWFRGRRDETAGLGDWSVDEEVWPDGLGPLIAHVRGLGMEFGLWVEPEMVSPDSDLARAHPDWILRARGELPAPGRQQQVLDLANPDVFDYLSDRLNTLLDEYEIAYLKWDHNRDLVEPGSGPHGRARTRENVHALYRLLDQLRDRHPGLEIESCASGGARVDLGILARTDRIWTSDCLDPLERLDNQRYTGLLVPPELLGAHLSSPVVHSTGRTVSLEFSAITAMFGHFGIEWDLTAEDAQTRARVGDWVRRHKELRGLLAHGRLVHADVADPALDVRGIVGADGGRAVFAITQVTTSAFHPPAPVHLPGLDPERRYRIRLIAPEGAGGWPGQSELAWSTAPIELSGRTAGTVGMRPPVQFPQSAVLVEAVALT